MHVELKEKSQKINEGLGKIFATHITESNTEICKLFG